MDISITKIFLEGFLATTHSERRVSLQQTNNRSGSMWVTGSKSFGRHNTIIFDFG